MVTYESIVEEIQKRYDADEITFEQAEDVNTLAYINYVLCEGIDLSKFKDKLDRKLDHEKTLAKKELALNNIKRKLKAGKSPSDEELAEYKSLKADADAIKAKRELKKEIVKNDVIDKIKTGKPVSDKEIKDAQNLKKELDKTQKKINK